MTAPGLTPRAVIDQLRGTMVFAVPHPAAHALAACIDALGAHGGFVAATVMLGASAGGRDTLADTVDQTANLLNARLDLEDDKPQRAFNILMREHERSIAAAIAAQAAALLIGPPAISVQAVAVPVLHGSGLVIEIPRPATRAATTGSGCAVRPDCSLRKRANRLA